MANILDETGSLLKAILGLDYGNKKDLIGDFRKGTNVLNDAHEGSSVKPMDVNQMGAPSPYDLTDAQLLDENALNAHVDSLAQKYASDVESTLPITPVQETVPKDLSAIRGIYGDLTQSTQDLMKLYGMDSSKLNDLGDFGIGDVLSSVDKQVKATEDYTKGMIESIDKRREILEKKPEANWMILIAAALLPKRKAAGLVSGYYKGIMERYNRDTERQLAVLDDEMKKSKFELDLEGARAGASESKMKLKMGMLQAVSQNIELAKKVQEITHSGTISKLAADISLKMINNNSAFPSDEELTNALKMAGVDENSIPIALSQLSSMISQNVYEYRTAAKLKSVGGSGGGSGSDEFGKLVNPNLYSTGNVESINKDFNTMRTNFFTAVSTIDVPTITRSFRTVQGQESLALWDNVFNANFSKVFEDGEDAQLKSLTMVRDVFLRPTSANASKYSKLVEHLIPVASGLRNALDRTQDKSSQYLLKGFDAFNDVASKYTQFEEDVMSVINTTVKYLYGDTQIDNDQLTQLLSNVRTRFISTLKDVGDGSSNVDITQNRLNWKNGEYLIGSIYADVINVFGPVNAENKNLMGLLKEALGTAFIDEKTSPNQLVQMALFGNKTTPFNSLIKNAQELSALAVNYYEFLLSPQVSSHLPTLIGQVLPGVNKNIVGTKAIVAQQILSDLLLMGDNQSNAALFWAINPAKGSSDTSVFINKPVDNLSSESSLSFNVKVDKGGNIKRSNTVPISPLNMGVSAVNKNIQNKNDALNEQVSKIVPAVLEKIPHRVDFGQRVLNLAKKRKDNPEAYTNGVNNIKIELKNILKSHNLVDTNVLSNDELVKLILNKILVTLADEAQELSLNKEVKSNE